MANTNLSIITFSLVIFISTFAVNGIPGGRTKIADVKTNKEVQDLGHYSVEEYNRLRQSRAVKNGEDHLTFYQVVEAEKQVVSGMKYYLTIKAFSKTSGEPKVFEAVVVVKPWLRSKQLLKFAPSPAAKISQLVW